MHWVSLILGVVWILLGTNLIWCSARSWPENTRWNFLASGKYTTKKYFDENKITIEDAYGKEVAEFRRVVDYSSAKLD